MSLRSCVATARVSGRPASAPQAAPPRARGRARTRSAIALRIGGVLVAAEEGAPSARSARRRVSTSAASSGAGSCSKRAAAPAGRPAARRPSENASRLFCDRDAVQLDRALHRRQAHRHQAALPGIAHAPGCWRRWCRRGTPRPATARPSSRPARRRRRTRSFSSSASTRRSASGLSSDSATGISCVLASTRVRPWRTVCSASADAATTRSQASTASACCASMRTWFSAAGSFGQAHEGEHRAALLREAHEVEHARGVAFEVRRHRDQRADRAGLGAPPDRCGGAAAGGARHGDRPAWACCCSLPIAWHGSGHPGAPPEAVRTRAA